VSGLSRAALLGLLLGCAVARSLVHAERPAAPARTLALPASLDREVGRALPLGPSEQTLARAPGVSVVRRAYGETQVALVSTAGIREVHPARVCLRSMGFEVAQRDEEQLAAGCVVHLVVRDSRRRTAHFFHTYLDEGARGRCDYWRRTGAAALERLAGRSHRWTTLQVMDRDPRRARRVLGRLLDSCRNPARAGLGGERRTVVRGQGPRAAQARAARGNERREP
jgi:hypothetical protein